MALSNVFSGPEIEQISEKSITLSEFYRKMGEWGVDGAKDFFMLLDEMNVVDDYFTIIETFIQLLGVTRLGFLQHRSSIDSKKIVSFVEDYFVSRGWGFDEPIILFTKRELKNIVSSKKSGSQINQQRIGYKVQTYNKNDYVDDVGHVAIRNELVGSSWPFVLMIVHLFFEHIREDLLQGIQKQDVLQECWLSNCKYTDICNTRYIDQYYESICWNTMATIVNYIIGHNKVFPIPRNYDGRTKFSTYILSVLKGHRHIEYHSVLERYNYIEYNPFFHNLMEAIGDSSYSLEQHVLFRPFSEEVYDVLDIDEDCNSVTCQNNFQSTLDEIISFFPNAKRSRVIIYYYGLGGEKPLTLESISKKMGISSSSVQQIKDNALSFLRRHGHDLRRFL